MFKADGRPGDRVVVVDGGAVKETDANAVQDLLDGKANTEATVQLDRFGEKVTVVYTRTNPFRPQSGPDEEGSLDMALTLKGSLESIESFLVTTVIPGGAADGKLRQNDEIIAIGGVALKGIDLDRLRPLLTKRAGEVITFTIRTADGGTRDVEITTRRKTP